MLPRSRALWTLSLVGATALCLAVSVRLVFALDQQSERGIVASQPASPDIAPQLSLGIVGSKHDFTGGGRVDRDLCLPCHTMHLSATQAPLLIKRPNTIEPLRPWQTRGIELDSASLLCLSCHDGIAASDVFAGAHGTNWADNRASPLAARPRLTGHPVGIPYPAARRDYEPSEHVAGAAGLKLPEGRIQCTTCHDPHNRHQHGGMLRISNRGSRLCLSCHRL